MKQIKSKTILNKAQITKRFKTITFLLGSLQTSLENLTGLNLKRNSLFENS